MVVEEIIFVVIQQWNKIKNVEMSGNPVVHKTRTEKNLFTYVSIVAKAGYTIKSSIIDEIKLDVSSSDAG